MLAALSIRNFVLIDALELRFEPGFCLLTGETGAGKSILIDALSAALGGRVNLEDIRHGEQRAFVEATFNRPGALGWPEGLTNLLDEEGIVPAVEGELTLSRELTARGSRCRLDGHQVTQAQLRRAGRCLADIVSQHEHQRLLDPEYQLELLDRHGRHGPLREAVARTHAGLQGVRMALRQHREEARERARQEDYWRFQLAELEAAGLEAPAEMEHLEAERLRLVHAQRLRQACQDAYQSLYAGENGPSAYDILARCLQPLTSLGEVDAVLGEAGRELAGLQAALRDVAADLRRHLDRLEADPARLAEVEQRVAQLLDVARKYGPGLEQAIARREELSRQLAAVAADDERLTGLEAERLQAEGALAAACEQLTQARRAAAGELERAVERELEHLEMGRARFAVTLCPHQTAPRQRASGQEEVVFEVALNPGEPPRALARTASGGEMARVMLALTSVLAGLDAVGTLVFDEVDTGISGRAAQAVAEKLATLARTHQVLCITHLPAVAAMADQHTHLEKGVDVDRTRVRATVLAGAARVRELAKLSSGDPGPAALRHAEALLAQAMTHKGGPSGGPRRSRRGS
ncbi:MAG: DNA repair protein RecN [Candidatus Sericytochromatia bacterium]|nr:DNA repair protein RecN [Candidatus Sericytochromatia bacterium]MEB3221444.1 DNA repair protein RecN [Candidatus Sericytochromatia bacterium]